MINKICKSLNGVSITNLSQIEVAGGDVLHGMKLTDHGYSGFGEAYFSKISRGVIKPWKRHRIMTLNIIVPVGEIRFVLYDDRKNSSSFDKFQEIIISTKNYCRLTVPPMIWMAFQGTGKSGGILLNIADIVHDPSEVDRKNIDEITFDWLFN